MHSLKPWHNIPIFENNERLVQIPHDIKFVEPHPYLKLGAPYKNINQIWCLREGVVTLLLEAQKYLQSKRNDLSLIVYDSWRPLQVQSFMFNMALKDELSKSGISFQKEDRDLYNSITKKVEKFWANPFSGNNSPPPHSTGGALDVSLIDSSGEFVEMGCSIDSMEESAEPDFYNDQNDNEFFLWNSNRRLLKETMLEFGFVQHPNEWWHFSYGDQLWAWKKEKKNALYGGILL